jgi:hypothetical protein
VIISPKGVSVCILALGTTCGFFVALFILGDYLCFTVVTTSSRQLAFEPHKGALNTPTPVGDTVQTTTDIMHQLRGHFTKVNLHPDYLVIIKGNGKRAKDTLPSLDPQIRTKIPSSHPPSIEQTKLASIGTRQQPARI